MGSASTPASLRADILPTRASCLRPSQHPAHAHLASTKPTTTPRLPLTSVPLMMFAVHITWAPALSRIRWRTCDSVEAGERAPVPGLRWVLAAKRGFAVRAAPAVCARQAQAWVTYLGKPCVKQATSTHLAVLLQHVWHHVSQARLPPLHRLARGVFTLAHLGQGRAGEAI